MMGCRSYVEGGNLDTVLLRKEVDKLMDERLKGTR